ncbi:sensor histidine kinase [Haloprofundus salilacus]|uniref:sensor histidine kinase n=1 Tax=Haloprofundus salilacus TaxID=2876190 RepID=UPI001CCF040A|nr:ATP-binding protein [Haloprofundus salilacus]
MGSLSRVSPINAGHRVIVVLGGMYIAVAFGWTLTQMVGSTSVGELIVFSLIAGPGAVLFFVGYRLPQSEIREEFYPTVVRWCLGGIVMMVAILTFYSLQPGEVVDDPSVIFILTGLASVAGLVAGTHNAQAKTRARELEELVEQLQTVNERLETSNERLEQFAYAASHDLQEPLRMVSSYLQLIESRYGDELDSDGREFIEFALDGANRMREMVKGLLQYSRVETQADPFEQVDLDTVLEDVLEDIRVQIEESNAEITKESLPTVTGDDNQLRQVFQNLLQNAIEYSGDGPPRVSITADRADSKWVVTVRDEGIGIEPKYSENIFEVFQRLHNSGEYPGTGIGLALCKRIVERHDGEIWVESARGEGATFSFSLPVAKETHGSPAASVSHRQNT